VGETRFDFDACGCYVGVYGNYPVYGWCFVSDWRQVMARFKIDWTEELWQQVYIEAESEEQARELFWQGEFDNQLIELYGTEVQDSVLVEEVA